MEILLTIKDDSKAEKILAMLKKYSFVKAKPVKTEKEQILSDLKEAIEEVKLHKKGKIKLKSARTLLNEL